MRSLNQAMYAPAWSGSIANLLTRLTLALCRRFWNLVTAVLASPCPAPDASNDETAGGVSASRSEEHTSELQSLMRISYDVVCLHKKNQINYTHKRLRQLSNQK